MFDLAGLAIGGIFTYPVNIFTEASKEHLLLEDKKKW